MSDLKNHVLEDLQQAEATFRMLLDKQPKDAEIVQKMLSENLRAQQVVKAARPASKSPNL